MEVLSVSSSVRLPELPEASMDTRSPIGQSPQRARATTTTRTGKRSKTAKMMAERANRVNGQETILEDNYNSTL
jgi:hypothetical protein